jgi:hypothetical protein
MADPLTAANDFFHSIYSDSIATTLKAASHHPVILAEGDKLVLKVDGKRHEAVIEPRETNTMKVVSHMPLAAFLLLESVLKMLPEEAPPSRSAISAETDQQMGALMDHISSLHVTLLAPSSLTQIQLQRQIELLDRTRFFLEEVRERGWISCEQLNKWTGSLNPLIVMNIEEAVRYALDRLHEQVMKWKEEMRPDQWDKVHVIVFGNHMARRGEMNMQYFKTVLPHLEHQPSRVMYGENLETEEGAEKLLGTHLVDSVIGAAFFKSPGFMHHDIRAPATKNYMPQLFHTRCPTA